MYLRSYLVLAILTFFCCSCQNYTSDEQGAFHKDGKAKPRVALIPVVDHLPSRPPSDLVGEFTAEIEKQLLQKGKVFLTDDFQSLYHTDINLFQEKLDWLHEESAHTEFVVLTELLRYKVMPQARQKGFFNFSFPQAYLLDMSLRVKVVDIRNSQPEIVLHKMFHQSFHIPWKTTPARYAKEGWMRVAYFYSPIGLAHNKMVQRISNHIHDYIILAKTK